MKGILDSWGVDPFYLFVRYVYHTDCNDRIVCDAEYKI